MWSDLVLLLWISALVFTIASFIWRRQVMITLFAAFFWISVGYSTVQINYVGFTSTGVAVYSHEMGDWYGDIPLFYLLTGVGDIMLIWSFYNFLLLFKDDVIAIDKGDGRNLIFEDTRGWK